METGRSTRYINIYEFHFFMYNLTGYSYVDFRVAWLKLLHAIFHNFVIAFLILHNILSVYMAYQVLVDPVDFMFVLSMAGTTTGCTMKICTMEFYKKDVLNLHKQLDRNLEISMLTGPKWAEKERLKTERQFEFITKAFYSITPGAFVIYIILPVFFPGEKAVPYLFPIKNLPSPYYETVYIVNSVLVILFMLNTVSYDMICWGLMLRISTNLNIVSGGIRKLGKIYPQMKYSERITGYSDYRLLHANKDEMFFCRESTPFCSYLKKCKSYEAGGMYDKNLSKKTFEFLSLAVRHHQDIAGYDSVRYCLAAGKLPKPVSNYMSDRLSRLSNSYNIEFCKMQISLMDRIFNFNIFIHMVAGTGVFCMSAASLFSDHFNILKDIRLSGFAFGGFIDLFIYCYCGSRYLQSEEDLRIALYSLPWYAMDLKVRKLLIFTMTRLQRIRGLSAGRICNVSLDLFLGILKFSHSFIALLSES